MAVSLSNQERIALENELQNVICEFVKVNNKKLQFLLAGLDQGLTNEKQLDLDLKPRSLLKFVGYLSENFKTAAKHFGDLHDWLKDSTLLTDYTSNFMLHRYLPPIKRVEMAIAACTEQYKSDNNYWHGEIKISTEQSSQTNSIIQLNQSTQCEKTKCENKSTNCILQTDITSRNEKVIKGKNCATNCDLTCDNVKSLNTQSTDAKGEFKHRGNGNQPNSLPNERKNQASMKRKIYQQNVNYQVKTQNRFAILPMEKCGRENFHPKEQQNFEHSSNQRSTQSYRPKFYEKNSIWQQQFHSKQPINAHFAKKSCKDEYLNVYFNNNSNGMKPENTSKRYSSSLQIRKWHAQQQQQQKQTFFSKPKERYHEKFNCRKSDDNTSNIWPPYKFKQQSNITQLVKIIAYWLEKQLPKKYSALSTNRHILSKRMKVLI